MGDYIRVDKMTARGAIQGSFRNALSRSDYTRREITACSFVMSAFCCVFIYVFIYDFMEYTVYLCALLRADRQSDISVRLSAMRKQERRDIKLLVLMSEWITSDCTSYMDPP